MADDYEDIIQSLDDKDSHKNPSIYDKKYFDYFPAKESTESGQALSLETDSDDLEFQPLFTAEEPKLLKTAEGEVDESGIEAIVHRRKRDISIPWHPTGKYIIICASSNISCHHAHLCLAWNRSNIWLTN